MDISVTDPSATIDLPSDVTVYDSTTGGSIAGDVNNPGSNSKTGSFFVAAFPAGSALDTTTIYSLMHNPTGKFERDSAGPFTLTALPAGTNYDVYLCVFNEFDNGLESIAVRDSDKNIALATTGLDLDYTSQGGSVTGKILDKEGQGITGAYVVFMNETDTEITGFTISEKDGEYEIHNLVAGTHKIHVTHTNYDDLNSPTVVVTNGGIATAGDIVLSSVEQDAIRAAYAAIEAAYQAENLAPLMALFRSDYLHNGKTKALAQQEYQSNFTDLENIDLIVSLPGITINGNNAIVEEDIRLTATVTSTGKPTEIFVKNDLQYWRKDDQDKLWYLYGNQKQFDVAVETMYFHDGNYRVGFYLESPSVDETSVSVNGPNVSNQALAYDSGDDEWHYDADFGTTKPDVGDIYTFTVAGPGGPYTQTEIVSGVVEDFSTLSSPIGGASTGLAPNFNWGAVNGAKYYYIEVFSGSTVNFPEVWSREINGSATSVTFNDDGQASAPLSQNQAYCWRVSACDKKWNSSVTDVAAFNTSTLSVSISPDAWSIGDVAIAEIKTMAGADKITVTNDGQLTSKYSLNAVNPAGWSASTTAAGDETYLVNAAFDSDGAGITWSAANHAISTTAAAATATKFAGDQQGTGVAASQTRRLFLQFHAPTKTAITSQQNIEVIITAEED